VDHKEADKTRHQPEVFPTGHGIAAEESRQPLQLRGFVDGQPVTALPTAITMTAV
jgi:hypothetical protein